MRRSPLAVSVLLLVACTEGTGGGPSFGSGSGSPTGAATMSSTAGGSSGPSGTAGSGDEASSGGLHTSTGTSEPTSAAESNTASGGSGTTSDAGSATGTDATGPDPSAESSGDSSGDPTVDGTPLDPSLDVPDEGESCTSPGNLNECPGIAVCRFYTAEEGRCESCDNCGNLNAPCDSGTDCDILFSCFAGRCTNFCQLGTFSCGPVEDCLDIGHATHGVCDPFA